VLTRGDTMKKTVVASVVLATVSLHAAVAITEKSTGYDFPSRSPRLGKLHALGVRKKGPIKVYAVGMYEDVLKHKGFMLQMAMGVGAQKMTNVRLVITRRWLS